MTTPTGRALAGMLAVFAEFEHEILRERVKAGIAQARSKGTTLVDQNLHARKPRKTNASIARKSSLNRKLQDASASAGPPFAAF
jgi:DNA invertase Pin-like site-specific DNA recombinase